ncbi:PREDICTED: F-box only protein 17 isoform X2 [Cercocebus atys]|uniref:F-box only protein 17 isoform X2 n=1 Tax=Cercocebus atys TaxID=9531 RepID=UPI0005F58520|nr:PREDICTED: F-box only protein 17 isoform X2 [Cercocebus atys]
MGARLSRRRLPADPSLALDALPPELLVQVLSHVPPRALVTRCRPVCRAWRDIVDGPTVWLLQLARDRSAEGRALYAVAQRCLPSNEDKEEFPLCALARYCLRAPFRRNLIFNSCGEQGFRGWEVEHGGNGWAIEKNLTPVPGAPSQTCFVTSFEWCSKRQLVDLVMEGVWQELLDSAQIEICVADWFWLYPRTTKAPPLEVPRPGRLQMWSRCAEPSSRCGKAQPSASHPETQNAGWVTGT